MTITIYSKYFSSKDIICELKNIKQTGNNYTATFNLNDKTCHVRFEKVIRYTCSGKSYITYNCKGKYELTAVIND